MVPLLNQQQQVTVVKQTHYLPDDIIVFADHSGTLLVHRFFRLGTGKSGLKGYDPT